EIPAPASGVLKEIKVAEGATVQVNTVVGQIDVEGSATATTAPPQQAPAKTSSAPSSSGAGTAGDSAADGARTNGSSQADGASTRKQPPATEKVPVVAKGANGGPATDVVMPQMGESI